MSTFPRWFWIWKCERQTNQQCDNKTHCKNFEQKTWSFRQEPKLCSRSKSSFWINLKKYKSWRFQKLWRTQKQYPVGSIQTCVHQGQLGKAKRHSQQNWRRRVLQSRKKEYKMEVLQVNKHNNFGCFTQKRTYGLQRCCFTRSSFEKLQNQLPHVRRN